MPPSFLLAIGLWAWVALAQAESVPVAVAANFAAPMETIAAQFEKDTGHVARLSIGSTGKLYAQISQGAPFEILLSADDKTPLKLEQEQRAVPGSRFTYALGKLVLWSRDADRVDAEGAVLRRPFERLAIADARLAPYGLAAEQTLQALGLLETLRPRFVTGENIAQTFQFVSTGNAPLGFVALSQVQSDGQIREGSGWIVPETLYAPIRQDAVLLRRGANNPAARALMDYLKGEVARRIIQSFGYGLAPPNAVGDVP